VDKETQAELDKLRAQLNALEALFRIQQRSIELLGTAVTAHQKALESYPAMKKNGRGINQR
jgi:prefoldin subunit 5